MSVFKISPRYDSSKLNPGTFDDRLDVYEDLVCGWLIDSGRILNRHEHAGFGVLQTALAYFEGYAVFFRGEDSRNRSRLFFKEGFESVFPEVIGYAQSVRDDFIDIMYYDGRCGLFHLGMARRRILLQDGSPVFRITTDASGQGFEAIRIDRYGLIDRIDRHLSSYAAQLRNPSAVDLRTRFEAAWAIVHQ
jgi:hypothetical protein